MLLGAWAFFAPLVGGYFDYGFASDSTWAFSTRQWELSLGAGLAIFAGGLLLAVPSRAPAWLGGLVAAIGGAWLLVGPSVYPLWASRIAPDGSNDMQTLKWIGYFYATGALTVYLAASRRECSRDGAMSSVQRRSRTTSRSGASSPT
jgi:xanthosine utilization system XapX-like protein